MSISLTNQASFSENSSLIETIKRKIRAGYYDDFSLKTEIEQLETGLSQIEPGGRDWLRSKGLIAEYYDYVGNYAKAKEIIGEERAIRYEELVSWVKSNSHPTKVDKQMLAEYIWMALSHATIVYRQHRLIETQQILELCKKAVKRFFLETDPPFVMARVEYAMGQAERQLHNYDNARAAFIESIRLSSIRLQAEIRKNQEDKELIEWEQRYANYNIAKCLTLGLAWIHVSVGNLREVDPYIHTARVLFTTSKDLNYSAHTDLIWGICLQVRAGQDREKLQEAARLLGQAEAVFEKSGHKTYRSRACYELAHVYLGMKGEKLVEAESSAQAAQAFAIANNDRQWLINSLVLLSRIRCEQRNYLDSVALAKEALDRANEHPMMPLGKIRALIALAEANIGIARFAEAREYLNEALRLGAENPRRCAICYLHLAKICLDGDGDVAGAEKQLGLLEKVLDKIEDVSLSEDMLKLKDRIEALKTDFTIHADSDSFDYQKHHRNLQLFLISQAKRKFGDNQENIAKALKISRQTLHKWRKSLGK